MSRYIDADKLIEHLNAKSKTDYEMGLYNHGALTESFIRFVERQPTADVVAVVRCRDCRWWTKQKDSIQGRCGMYERYPTGAWYCANGERREK